MALGNERCRENLVDGYLCDGLSFVAVRT